MTKLEQDVTKIRAAINAHLASGGKLVRQRWGVYRDLDCWRPSDLGCCALGCFLAGKPLISARTNTQIREELGWTEDEIYSFIDGFDGVDHPEDVFYRAGRALQEEFEDHFEAYSI